VKGTRSRDKALRSGRSAFQRRAWDAAFVELKAADSQSRLVAEDVELLAMSAHLTGREAESFELLTRAQQDYQKDRNLQSAARCAFWLGFITLLNGDLAQGSGWLARTRRLLEECGQECVVHGYLHIPDGYRAAQLGNAVAAAESFADAGKIGMKFQDIDLISMARQGQGRVLIRQGEIARGLSLLDEAMIAVTSGEVTPIVAGGIYCSVIESCNETFDLRRAQEWTSALEQWCSSQPDLVPYRGSCLIHRAEILQRNGSWQDALEEAQRARDQLSTPKLRPAVGSALYRIGEIHRLRGEFTEAEAAYREASEWGQGQKPGMALLRLAQGSVEAAKNIICQLVAEVQGLAARSCVLEAAVEIALASGDADAAHSAANDLGEIADKLDVPFVGAMSAQAKGAVLLAQRNFLGAQSSLRRALAAWRELEVPYETARVRVLLAAACKELGDATSSQLELQAARDEFEHLGALPDIQRISTLSQSARSNSVLTPRELEVVTLLASGNSNRDIAKKLFISEKTVARHISNIFTKLNLSSRAAATAYAFRNNLVSASST